MPKFLRTREYNLEQKCDQNLCVLLLFIAVVACDLNCIVRMVHAHPFWALTAFLVCFLSLAVGQIELTWVQNAPSKFTKEYILPEKQYTRCIMIIFSQGASCMYVRTYVCTNSVNTLRGFCSHTRLGFSGFQIFFEGDINVYLHQKCFVKIYRSVNA